MTQLYTALCAVAATPSTGDDTPVRVLATIAALALCVLTGITCWRVFGVRKTNKKEQPHDETPPQTPHEN